MWGEMETEEEKLNTETRRSVEKGRQVDPGCDPGPGTVSYFDVCHLLAVLWTLDHPTVQHRFNPLPCLPRMLQMCFWHRPPENSLHALLKLVTSKVPFICVLETICLSSEKSLCTLEWRKTSLMTLVWLGLMTMGEPAFNLYTSWVLRMLSFSNPFYTWTI